MNNPFGISASTDHLEGFLNFSENFFASAQVLVGMGISTTNPRSGHFFTALFLYRHSIELAIKALMEEIGNSNFHSHDIEKLWGKIPNHQHILANEIKRAFEVLRKYNILKDAQLFRYPMDKSGDEVKNMDPIKNEDFDALDKAADYIQQAVREHIHIYVEKIPLPLNYTPLVDPENWASG